MAQVPQLGRHRVAPGRRRLLGWGAALPGPALSSDELCERIARRFGVRTERHARLLAPRLGVRWRHLCRDFERSVEAPRPGARNPELAARALVLARERAGLGAGALGYLISHTATPARLLPAGSAEIAQLCGHDGAHAELRQACTGFANALQFAFGLTQERDAPPIGIVGVETGSVFFDPASLAHDASQWVNFLQMGDGAAAVVVGPDDGGPGPYIAAGYFGQCGSAPAPGLALSAGGSDCVAPPPGPLRFEHDYAAVARHGMVLLDAGRSVLATAGFDLRRAALVVPHQASGAVAPWLSERWGLEPSRVCSHAIRVGNLGSASIWAALDDALSMHVPCAGSAPWLFLGAEATQYSYGGFALEF